MRHRNTATQRRTAIAARGFAAALLAAGVLAACSADRAAPDPLEPTGKFSVYQSQAAQTPPMGWNPWNAFRTDVDEAKIRGSAEALVAHGLADLGYRYVNIDDGWSLQRLPDGRIRIRDSMFPSARVEGSDTGSFRPFVDYIHSLGLKAGLYTDIGRNTCAQRWDAHSPNLPIGSMEEREVGSFGHAAEDMRTIFADWGFDYVKIDACGVADYAPDVEPVVSGNFRVFPPMIVRGDIPASDPQGVEDLYARLGEAIRTAGGDTAVLSICAWGEALSPRWAHRRGNLWRTSPDIEFTWESMLRNLDSAVDAALYAGPGRWNDPDMLAVGHGDFDAAHLPQARAHLSMWAILSAPLLLGYDLRDSPQSLIDVIGNPEVIAIDQDRAGNQGVPLARDGDVMVVVKTLAEQGARAVAFLNRGDAPRTASVSWQELGLAAGQPATVRDLWRRSDLPSAVGGVTVQLPPRQAVLLRIVGAPAEPAAAPLHEMPARINVAVDGLGNNPLPQGWTPARVGATPNGDPLRRGEEPASGVGLFANSRLEIRADGEFRSFVATPAAYAGAAPVRFRVYADRKLAADVAVEPGALAEPIEADVAGAAIVELVAVTDAKTDPPMIAWLNAGFRR